MAPTFYYFSLYVLKQNNPFRSWEHLGQHTGLKGLGVTVTMVRRFDKDTHQDANSILFSPQIMGIHANETKGR